MKKLFWPWEPIIALAYRGVIKTHSVVASVLGLSDHVGNRRARDCSRFARAKSDRGGGVHCMSFRMTRNLEVADVPVWSMRHMSRPFPTTRAWGCHYFDVACVFGNSPSKAYVRRQCACTLIEVQVGVCHGATKHERPSVSIAQNWVILQTCFCA